MKIISPAILLCIVLLGTSCQKDISAVDVSNGVDTAISTGNVLVKTVKTSRTSYSDASISNTNYIDSIVTEYTYDGNGRLINMSQTDMAYDSVTHTAFKNYYFNGYKRDGLGRVIKWLFGGRDMNATTVLDTFFTEYYYAGSTSPLVAYEKPYGVDSNVYIHNTAGQVVTIKKYGAENGTPEVTGHQDFTYDGNNDVTQIKVYGFSDNQGFHPDGLAFTYSYQYDNNTNPLYTGDDMMPEYVWVDPAKMHNNAVLYTQEENALNGNLMQKDTRVYQYRTDRKPVTLTQSIYYVPDVGPHTISKTIYFYK